MKRIIIFMALVLFVGLSLAQTTVYNEDKVVVLKTYQELSSFLEDANKLFGVSYPTSVENGRGKLERLTQKAARYSEKTDHVYRFRYVDHKNRRDLRFY